MGPRQRILIVDDDPAFVRATSVVLDAHGYEVHSARNGDEALAEMVEQRPNLVLLDVMMNWPLEGVHLSQEMLTRRELRNIPIIMVTSIVESEYRGMFPQDEYLHIDSWLDKPCPADKLVAEVERVLSRRERHAVA